MEVKPPSFRDGLFQTYHFVALQATSCKLSSYVGTVYVSSFCDTTTLDPRVHEDDTRTTRYSYHSHAFVYLHRTIFLYKVARHAKHTKHTYLTTFGRCVTASPSLTDPTVVGQLVVLPPQKVMRVSRKDISGCKGWFNSLASSRSPYES